LRSNGYSLVRAALLGRAGRGLDDEAWPGAGHSLVDELLRPSLIYTPVVLALLGKIPVRAVAHITGGGIPGNVPRALPPYLDAVLHIGTWPVPAIFGQVQEAARLSNHEMERTFNLGLGMVVTVPPGSGPEAVAIAAELGFSASVVGELAAGTGRCLLQTAPA
jgi:phosphoribosylformylglycinamidine cyclo-ligase